MKRRYEDLVAWQKAHELSLSIYRVTSGFPNHELYGLVSQMRRAAVSTVANIVEGHSRNGSREFRSFLSIARGSANELDYYLLLARDLGYQTEGDFQQLRDQSADVLRLVTALLVSIDKQITCAKDKTQGM